MTVTLTCSHCGLPITSAVFPAPHPPECGPPARLCVSCRRDAVDRWSRMALTARQRLERAAPALLQACETLIAWSKLDEGEHGITLPGCVAQARAAVALALPEEKTDAT